VSCLASFCASCWKAVDNPSHLWKNTHEDLSMDSRGTSTHHEYPSRLTVELIVIYKDLHTLEHIRLIVQLLKNIINVELFSK
jgi:hypothetical protein